MKIRDCPAAVSGTKAVLDHCLRQEGAASRFAGCHESEDLILELNKTNFTTGKGDFMKRFTSAFLCFTFFLVFFGSSALFGLSERDKQKTLVTDHLSGDKPKSPILNSITVISSRLPSFRVPLSDVPANVTYIPANITIKSEEELREKNPRSYQEALRDIEGAVFYDNVGNNVDKTFSLRGFAEGSAIITLVDGVRVNEVDGDAMNYPLIPMYDVESIQVERGSQSSIYGSGAFGGVVNIISRQPSSKLIDLFGGTEWSSFSGIRFHQGISGTIPDKLILPGGGVTYYFDMGRNLNQGFRNNSEIRITSLDAKLGYQLPDDSGGINVSLKHVEDALSNPGELTLDQFHNDAHATNKPLDGRDFRNSIIQFGADKKFWDDKIASSILAYWRTNWIHFFSTFATFSTAFPTQLTTVRSRSTDLIWQTAYEDRWKWFGNHSEVGVELEDQNEHDSRQDVVGGNVVEGNRYRTDRSGDPFSTAFFWRETIDVSRRIFLHYGMRHNFSWSKIEDNLTPANNYSRRWRKSTLSTGVVVKPIESIDLFSNYSQGFRVPALSEINSFNSDLNATLEPEKSNSYEVGTRLRYQDVTQFKTSWFLIDVEDEIVFDGTVPTNANPFGRNINAGKTRRYGVENRIDITPAPEISGYGSYTFTKALIAEAPPGGTPFNDRELGQVPAHRFTAGIAIQPLKRFGDPYDGFKLMMDGVFTGWQRTEAYESTSQTLINAVGSKIKPYMVWNFMVLFEWKQQQIYFKINNLLGENYFSRARAASSSGGIYPSGNYLFVNPGAPREFVIGMNWKFGK